MLLYYSIVCLFIANIIAYYQLNGQFFLKEWYWHNPWTTSMIGYPVGMLFWYATKLSYEHFGFTWNMRMIGFGIGTIVFGIMSYLTLKEVPTLKTIICILLATAIILIQFTNVVDE